MKQFEYVEDAKLGKPKTPSKWKCFPEYTLITKVRMTCGGGLDVRKGILDVLYCAGNGFQIRDPIPVGRNKCRRL